MRGSEALRGRTSCFLRAKLTTSLETLQHVSSEIKKEETLKLSAEQQEHRSTQEALASERAAKKKLQQRLYWQCRRRAKSFSVLISGLLVILLIVGLVSGIGLRVTSPTFGWLLALGSGAVFIFGLVSFVFGTTVRSLHERMQEFLLARLIRREAVASGVELPTTAE